ncbi:proline-rich membrane anchor 1 [Aplochiton taeniatus]
MLVQDILPLILGFSPFVFGQYFLTSILLSFQFTQGEVQKSCSPPVAERLGESCPLACQCRPYPPLPPPPPPPPPPRLLLTVAPSIVPPMKPWWKEILVLGTVSCASITFLLLTAIICYKAIKRKPLRKEENGTGRGEYAMSCSSLKTVDTNNTGVEPVEGPQQEQRQATFPAGLSFQTQCWSPFSGHLIESDDQRNACTFR